MREKEDFSKGVPSSVIIEINPNGENGIQSNLCTQAGAAKQADPTKGSDIELVTQIEINHQCLRVLLGDHQADFQHVALVRCALGVTVVHQLKLDDVGIRWQPKGFPEFLGQGLDRGSWIVGKVDDGRGKARGNIQQVIEAQPNHWQRVIQETLGGKLIQEFAQLFKGCQNMLEVDIREIGQLTQMGACDINVRFNWIEPQEAVFGTDTHVNLDIGRVVQCARAGQGQLEFISIQDVDVVNSVVLEAVDHRTASTGPVSNLIPVGESVSSEGDEVTRGIDDVRIGGIKCGSSGNHVEWVANIHKGHPQLSRRGWQRRSSQRDCTGSQSIHQGQVEIEVVIVSQD